MQMRWGGVAGVLVTLVWMMGTVAAEDQRDTGASTTTAAVLPAGAVAVVNGEVIAEKDLVDFLISRSGRQGIQQLLVLRLIDQELRRRGLSVTDAEIKQLLAARIAQAGGEAAYRQRIAERGDTLDYVRQYQLRTELALRKLTAHEVAVTEEEVRAAYVANYGEQRQVRRIIADDPRVANDILKQLEAGEDFAAVASARSSEPRDRQVGGLLKPFGRGSLGEGLKAFEDEAFKLKVGQMSGFVGVGDKLIILKLERIIPQRDDVPYESVKDGLRDRLVEGKVAAASNRLLAELRQKAAVTVRDDLSGGSNQDE